MDSIEKMIDRGVEGGEYLKCPKCGRVMSVDIYADAPKGCSSAVCGKCGALFMVHWKLIGFEDANE